MQISVLRANVSAWPTSSNAITTTAAPWRRAMVASWMNFSSPSFIEIEFTTGLPCTHFRPASITVNFEEVHHDGDAGDVGLGGDEVEERHHRGFGIQQALVHVDVDDLGAVLDLVARHRQRCGVIAGGDQFAEFRRAGDVGALADVDKRDRGRQFERLEAGEPQARLDHGNVRGLCGATAAAIAAIWSGVVPQQPPTMLTRPAAANSPISPAMNSGLSSYWPNSLGRPALG